MNRLVVPLLLAGVLAAGCSVPSAPAAQAEPASASPTQAATTDAASPTVGPLTCSGSDNGVKSGYEAWRTLVTADSGFQAWEQATSDFVNTVNSAAQVDAAFSGAGAPDVAAAQALATALGPVLADYTQGASTGEAPASYASDAQAVASAELPFEACAG